MTVVVSMHIGINKAVIILSKIVLYFIKKHSGLSYCFHVVNYQRKVVPLRLITFGFSSLQRLPARHFNPLVIWQFLI